MHGKKCMDEKGTDETWASKAGARGRVPHSRKISGGRPPRTIFILQWGNFPHQDFDP